MIGTGISAWELSTRLSDSKTEIVSALGMTRDSPRGTTTANEGSLAIKCVFSNLQPTDPYPTGFYGHPPVDGDRDHASLSVVPPESVPPNRTTLPSVKSDAMAIP